MSSLPASSSNETVRSSQPARSSRLVYMTFALVFLLGLFMAQIPTLAQMARGNDSKSSGANWDLVTDVERLVNMAYVEKPDQAKLTKGAIDGLLEALDDPYAEYIPADEAADFEKQMTGSFSGIGCQIDVHDGWLYVVSPLEDSPAFNAGILAGDKITKVDGQTTQNKTADQCIKMITGREGTKVHLDIQRMGRDLSMDITRARIVSKSVRGFRRLSDNSGHWDYLIDPEKKIAYIRMSQFTPTSPKELQEALAQAETEAGVKPGQLGGLILDLRNNPGGLMDSAIEIVDMFIDQGRIMSTKGRAFPEVVYKASVGVNTPTYPMAVLVNGSSASASEIVSGSLQENKRAIVIGTRSFGKGLVQTVQSLRDDPGASVKFTTQHYYLPSGRLIQRTDKSTEWGVDPSPGMYVPLTSEEEIALAYRQLHWGILHKEGTALPEGYEAVPPLADQHWTDPSWVESAAKDKQLAGAIRTMDAKIASGDWVALNNQPDEHGQLALAELKRLEKTETAMSKEFARIEKRIETLQNIASTGKGQAKQQDLWADSLDLTGGAVEVRDKAGKVVADLKITGRDLERWLAMADVEKTAKDTAKDTSKDTHEKTSGQQ
ncbi:MAG TPA: S41 family peptidase [Phycisphaerales bacterium]|nr:S41 family peptidase [Phycisphaerales bacterium]